MDLARIFWQTVLEEAELEVGWMELAKFHMKLTIVLSIEHTDLITSFI